MATPVVSGVAALGIAAAGESLSPEKLRQYLTETAVDIGLDEEKQGAGRVDAAKLVTAVSDDRTFVDVPQDHWAFYQIESLIDNKVISGYSDGTFRPGQSITRAEVAAMLTKAFDLEPGDASFSDTEEHWAKEAINAAASAGFLSGYPDGSFKPTAEITRQEIVVALSTGLTEESDLNVEEQLEDFEDADAIAEWARKPIARANKADLLENDQRLSGDADTQSATTSGSTDGFWSAFSFDDFLFAAEPQASDLAPQQATTRAGASNFLWNLMTSDEQKESL
jgi:hypothetical protein